MSELRFPGDLGPGQGLLLALLVAAAAGFLYFRQLAHRRGPVRFGLPLLRATVVCAVLLMLTQPVWHRRRVAGELSRLYVVLDDSASMDTTDRDLSLARRLLGAKALGWYDGVLPETELSDAWSELWRRRAGVESALARSLPAANVRTAADALAASLDRTLGLLGKAAAPPAGGTGGVGRRGALGREAWTNLAPNLGTIEDLAAAGVWNRPPDVVGELAAAEGPANWNDHYAARLRGYVHPPADGDYVFRVAADDACQLFLSRSENPADQELIARTPIWTEPRQWQKHPAQQSRPIALRAGKLYYLEVLHVEGAGRDHVAVGWQLPDGTREEPIPDTRLSAAGSAGSTPAALAQALRDGYRQDAAAGALTDPRPAAVRLLGAAQLAADTTLARLTPVLQAFGDRHLAAGKAAERFGAATRYQRAQALLFEGATPLLRRLANRHDVKLLRLATGRPELRWATHGPTAELTLEQVQALLPPAAGGEFTDLASVLAPPPAPGKTAVLLFTDGQHNLGASPLEAARLLGVRGVPVYAVGLGDPLPPRDLAIQEVTLPPTVFHQHRVRGQLAFLDTMPAGQTFKARVLSGGELLWQQELQTLDCGRREVAFDFAVETAVARLLSQQAEQLTCQGLTLPLKFELSPLTTEQRAENNTESLAIQVGTRRHRVLMVEAQPRWEWRYLNNLLDRDAQWETNAVAPELGATGWRFKRGAGRGLFPATQADLFGYDLIVLGDVPASLFATAELGWLAAFVREQGGGLILLDGRRGSLAGYANTPAAPLLPVTWSPVPAWRLPGPLALTAAGRAVAALDLGTAGADPAGGPWAKLPPPHWLAAVQPLPGAEVLLDADVEHTRAPALVFRRYGAGKVLYSAADEFWRWRRVAAGEEHERFWNQLAGWVMEAPFPVRDRYLALDAGAAVYRAGEGAQIRARLRDRTGAPWREADAQALFYRADQLVATAPLAAAAAAGLYRATSPALEPGDYTVRVRVAGLDPQQLPASVRFVVRPAAARELADLSCQERLLAQLAAASGGVAFREEQAGQVPETLQALSAGRVEETDTPLWLSGWFFAALVLLLTLEWLWRRRAGLI